MSADSAVQGTGEGIPEPSVDRALALLTEALAVVDALNGSPEIGARLQEVIELLGQRTRE